MIAAETNMKTIGQINSVTTSDRKLESVFVNNVALGDRKAITEFYDTYIDRLYAAVFNQVGRDHNTCQEIVQDTFLAAIKSAATFKGNCRPYTWLYSIARRKIADYYRKKNRVRLVQYESLPDMDDVVCANASGKDPVTESEDEQLAKEALGNLPLHYQEILLLKYVDEMTMKEIGIALNRSVKSVEGLLLRARRMFKKALVGKSEGLVSLNPTKEVATSKAQVLK